MNVVMLANAWSAGINNPTSKHRIALRAGESGSTGAVAEWRRHAHTVSGVEK